MYTTSQRWRGRFAFMLGFIALLLLAGLLGIWGTQVRIAGAIIAPGQVKVESNRQVIQHPDGGIVDTIYVRNGDYIEAGQAVLRFDDADVRSELSIVENQLLEVVVRIARLRAERDGAYEIDFDLTGLMHLQTGGTLDGQRLLFEARQESFVKELEQIDEQITQTRKQIVGVDAQIEAINIQLNLLGSQISANEELRKQGFMAPLENLEPQHKQAQLAGERGRLLALRGQHFSNIAALKLRRIGLETTRREKAITELRDLEGERAELIEKQRIANRKLSRMKVITPVSGIVYGSNVFAPRSVVQKGKDIMYIVPQDQALVISVRVPASDVDQVTPGQDVSLRFTALDQRFTPEIFGILNKVSADSVLDEKSGKAFYEAEISPLGSELIKLGDQSLVPGMPVDAYIRTSERSPLNYLTKPLADYFYRAFREE